MTSIFDKNVREQFHHRIAALRPEAERRWGRMNARQMICHLADQLRISLGEISTEPLRGPLRYSPIKQLVIDVLPWPKGRVKGPPEAFVTLPGEWERDVAILQELLERFGPTVHKENWAPHPMFGKMNGSLWSRLTCRHFDHHLRQFGA